MANGIDWNALLGQSGFAQAQQGISQELPWWKNANLLASVLGETGAALDPENPLAGGGRVAAQFGQANIMEAARKKKEDENRQLMQYMVGLLSGGSGGFTPPDQPGPTRMTVGPDKMTLDITPEKPMGADELGLSGFNAPTPARNMSGFNVPSVSTKVNDLQNIFPF